MKKEYRVFQYKNYIGKIVLICVISLIVPAVYFWTKDANETLSITYVIFPIVFSSVLSLIMYFSRKIFIGKLAAFDLDYDIVYLLDKRGEKHQTHNIKLLMQKHFFNGEFQEAIICANKIIEINSRKDILYNATHYKILSLFLNQQIDEILTLIELQDNLSTDNTLRIQDANIYYEFIKKYVDRNYNEAIKIIKNLLQSQDIDTQNHKKVLIFYLIKMCCEKINDFEQIKKCNNEILLADKNRKTFFSRGI